MAPLTRKDTDCAASSCRRSRSFCEVTWLPLARPRGDELGLKTIANVGGSMVPGESGSVTLGCAMVSPMPALARPAMPTMSPAHASSRVTRFCAPARFMILVTCKAPTSCEAPSTRALMPAQAASLAAASLRALMNRTVLLCARAELSERAEALECFAV
jgi:hypothetical protein